MNMSRDLDHKFCQQGTEKRRVKNGWQRRKHEGGNVVNEKQRGQHSKGFEAFSH